MTDIANDTVIKFLEQADTAAQKLQENMRSGYTQGYEMTLADAIYDGLDEAGRREVLEYLIHDFLTGYPMIGGVLDECATESYDLLGRYAHELAGLAIKQGLGHNDISLRSRIADHICALMRAMQTLTTA